MALTSAQLATLNAAINGNQTWAAYPQTSDGYTDLAATLNKTAAPAFIVWKSSVGIRETGQAFNGAEWAGMTTANHTRLQTVAQYLADGYNAAKADVRAMFNDIWSGAGGANTRTALLALWKRSATEAEKLLASGTGSDAVPATLGYEGSISYQDVQQARTN